MRRATGGLRSRRGARSSAALALAAALALTLAAAPARAGTYEVRQCDAVGRGLSPEAPDAVAVTPTSHYAARDRCAGDDPDHALKLQNTEPAQPDQYARWVYAAPPTTRLVAAELGVLLVNDHGHHGLVYTSDPTHAIAERLATRDTDGFESVSWRARSGPAATALVARIRCEPAVESFCAESGSAKTMIRNLRLVLEDAAPPSLTYGGPLAAGGWHAGAQQIDVTAHDSGGGVRLIEVRVNGVQVAKTTYTCALSAGIALRLQPCASERTASVVLDTLAAPFHEGPNDVLVCAEDYAGDDPNGACQSITVKVDNIPPDPPENIRVAGGDGWHRINDFDVSWDLPGQEEWEAPIDGGYYEVVSRSGAEVLGPEFLAPERNQSHVDQIQLPTQGEYRIRVWLRDKAGNSSQANATSTWLRFDDVPPGPPSLDPATGWISRDELAAPYVARWQAPSSIPVSGVSGYAVVVDRSATTNPCDAQGEPEYCDGAEITNGPGELARAVSGLPEGSSWVHVAAVSGSGVRSSSVAHSELRVDLTDPETRIEGVPSGWTRNPVTVVASASDALSGMQPQPGDDGAPATSIQVDGTARVANPGNEASVTISADGDHLVRAWARDLAGNSASTHPVLARARVDATAPRLAFANSQDPSDPELIRAPVSDPLSGVAGGEIAYRRQGATQWTPLATELRQGELRARLPSDQLADGTYELRATALDAAGNEAETTSREDGAPMTLEVPLKIATTLRAGLGPGARRLTIGYDRASRVAGRLVDPAGAPVAGQELTVSERFASGALDLEREHTITTGEDGTFRLGLLPGPNRRVTVSFDGTRRYSASASHDLRLLVHGSARFAATERRIRAGHRFAFYGRVRHLGARLPDGGKLVELQVRRPEGWDTVRQAFRTRATGRWRFPFRFGDYYYRPTRFRFRLKVVREAGWPYRPVKTRGRRVIVVPK